MKFWPIISVLLLLLPNASRTCRTYSGQLGSCMKITSCRTLMRIFKTRPPLDFYDEVRRTLCGFEDDKVPRICCAFPQAPPSEFENPSGPPARVDGHPNLRLLESELCDLARAGADEDGPARLFEFPWMVLLGYHSQLPRDNNGLPDFRCGGTIINARYVLTAAHCVTDLPDYVKLTFLRVGEHNLTTERDCETLDNATTICAPKYQDVGFEKIHVHPEHSNINFRNDIALIRLNMTLNFHSSSVRPVCLPLDPSKLPALESGRAVAAGWGATRPFSKGTISLTSPVLMKVSLPLLPLQDCLLAFPVQLNQLSQRQLCAGGEPGRDTCSGDSGGPLLAHENSTSRNIQLGIISFGGETCASDKPAVYTSVPYYLAWMLDTIED